MSAWVWEVQTALACAVSASALIALGLTDPKRRRPPHRSSPPPKPIRRALLLAALLPGLWLLATAQSVGFLIWLGCVALAGWVVALSLHMLRLGVVLVPGLVGGVWF
ncbi:MAG: hypothetical protein MI824_22300 [Hyphomicrobiales bacterium]|nr:hypothetical protein [Hyphomicrobiales bacterium]